MKVKLTKNLGMLLLGVWLIITGLTKVVGSGDGLIMAVLATAAGVLIVLGR